MSTNRAKWDRETRPMFAKRHYEFIADVLNEFYNRERSTGETITLVHEIIESFSHHLKMDNHHFDKSKFVSRAKGKEE